jgi:hypothetical protein
VQHSFLLFNGFNDESINNEQSNSYIIMGIKILKILWASTSSKFLRLTADWVNANFHSRKYVESCQLMIYTPIKRYTVNFFLFGGLWCDEQVTQIGIPHSEYTMSILSFSFSLVWPHILSSNLLVPCARNICWPSLRHQVQSILCLKQILHFPHDELWTNGRTDYAHPLPFLI